MIPLATFTRSLLKVMHYLSFIESEDAYSDIAFVWEKLLSLAKEKDDKLFEIIERTIGDSKEIATVAYAEDTAFSVSSENKPSFWLLENWPDEENYYYEALEVVANSVYTDKMSREAARQILRPYQGYIYFLSCEEGYTKIGRSKEPQTRIAGFFNTLPPFEFTIEHIFPASDDRQAEKELHERFADKRKNGEWFLLTQKDLQWAKRIEEYTAKGFCYKEIEE